MKRDNKSLTLSVVPPKQTKKQLYILMVKNMFDLVESWWVLKDETVCTTHDYILSDLCPTKRWNNKKNERLHFSLFHVLVPAGATVQMSVKPWFSESWIVQNTQFLPQNGHFDPLKPI